MRGVFFILLLAKVLLFVWTQWLAPAPPPPPPSPIAALPRLVLAGEVEDAGESDGAQVTATAAVVRTAGARCVTIGPFADAAAAERAAALLQERGMPSRQRTEAAETLEGYWVYLAGLRTAAEQTAALELLERNGIRDAQPMRPEGSEGRNVSLGLFSERERAERRAQAVQRLGLAPQIAERRQSGAVHWLELSLDAGADALDTEGLLDIAAARLEIRACPGEPAASPTPEEAVPATPPEPPPATPAMQSAQAAG